MERMKRRMNNEKNENEKFKQEKNEKLIKSWRERLRRMTRMERRNYIRNHSNFKNNLERNNVATNRQCLTGAREKNDEKSIFGHHGPQRQF